MSLVGKPADLFAALASSYSIFRGDQPLPGAGPLLQAAVTPVFCNRNEANALVHELGNHDPDKLAEKRVVKIGDPLTFMRRAAGWGFGGLVCYSPQDQENLGVLGFIFMTRVEEAGRNLPTVLTAAVHGKLGPSLTRLGPRELSHDAIIHWLRYDIMDRLSALFGKTHPFRDWDSGDGFFEIRSPHSLIRILNVGLLGHWLSIDGAVPFFTSQDTAEVFLKTDLQTGWTRHAIDFVEFAKATDYRTAFLELAIQPITDLASRLTELQEWNPFLDVVINPASHRENSAYLSLSGAKNHANPRWTKLIGKRRDWWLRAPSGMWRLSPRNKLKLLEAADWWSGSDTLYWDGGPAIQLAGATLTLQTEPLRVVPIAPAELSDTELREEVELFLTHVPHESWDADSDPLDSFAMLAWDTESGDAGIARFPSPLHALRYLVDLERTCDRCRRGLEPDELDERGEQFRTAILNIASRIVRQGYSPQDSHDTVSIAHATLVSLHIDFLGYPRDLFWASNDAERDALLERLEVNRKIWQAWADQQRSLPVEP
jgi:hypothetical protein